MCVCGFVDVCVCVSVCVCPGFVLQVMSLYLMPLHMPSYVEPIQARTDNCFFGSARLWATLIDFDRNGLWSPLIDFDWNVNQSTIPIKVVQSPFRASRWKPIPIKVHSEQGRSVGVGWHGHCQQWSVANQIFEIARWLVFSLVTRETWVRCLVPEGFLMLSFSTNSDQQNHGTPHPRAHIKEFFRLESFLGVI